METKTFSVDIEEFYEIMKRMCNYSYLKDAVFIPGMILVYYDIDRGSEKLACQHHIIHTDTSKPLYNKYFIIDFRLAKAKLSDLFNKADDYRKDKKFKPKEMTVEANYIESDDYDLIGIDVSLPDGWSRHIVIKLERYTHSDSRVQNVIGVQQRTVAFLPEERMVSRVRLYSDEVFDLSVNTPYQRFYEVPLINGRIVRVPFIRSYLYSLRRTSVPKDVFITVASTVDENCFLVTFEYQNKSIKEAHIQLIGDL